MRTSLLLAIVTAIGTALWTPGAVAQNSSSNSSVVESPSSSGSTGSNAKVNDKTGNTNTMNSQGSTSGGGTVGSSIVPPAGPNAPKNPSGSGTSTSGGVDYNGDKGADQMKR